MINNDCSRGIKQINTYVDIKIEMRRNTMTMLRTVRTIHTAREPLRVAFFGSDAFSGESLRRVVMLMNKGIVSSVDVIAKHPKPTGRDLRQMTDVPIVEEAQMLGVPVVRAETSGEINELIQKKKYTMAIAVSYGRLIPKKFLGSVPFSLNVHPSLLPKYSGASPLQFALINDDKTTGVSVQTLHPTQFDKGAIVAQIDGIEIHEDETLGSLRSRCATEGAQLLSDVLEQALYIKPSFVSTHEYSYAPKITPQMSKINWANSTKYIYRQYNTMGPLYTYKEVILKRRRKPLVHEWRRVILSEITKETGDYPQLEQPGEFILIDGRVIVKTSDSFIGASMLQLEFEKKEPAQKFMDALPKRAGETTNIFTSKTTSIN